MAFSTGSEVPSILPLSIHDTRDILTTHEIRDEVRSLYGFISEFAIAYKSLIHTIFHTVEAIMVCYKLRSPAEH
jgi:hypothetical protein